MLCLKTEKPCGERDSLRRKRVPSDGLQGDFPEENAPLAQVAISLVNSIGSRWIQPVYAQAACAPPSGARAGGDIHELPGRSEERPTSEAVDASTAPRPGPSLQPSGAGTGKGGRDTAPHSSSAFRSCEREAPFPTPSSANLCFPSSTPDHLNDGSVSWSPASQVAL